MNELLTISIETSCRVGGVALGRGDAILATAELGGSRRHACDLLPAIDGLLREQGASPTDLDEVYISVGPGGFTGLRVGVTAVRTMGTCQPSLRIVAVPTPLAIAQNVLDMPWQRLGVVLAGKRHPDPSAHVTWVDRQAATCSDGEILPADALWDASRADGTVLIGEALGYLETPDDVNVFDESRWYPTAQSVWRLGRQMSADGKTTPASQLLPHYARRPEAIRLWEKLHGA